MLHIYTHEIIKVFIGSVLSFDQYENYKSNQILHAGPKKNKDHIYRLLGAVRPPLLDHCSVQTDHSRHPLQETVLTFDPIVIHSVTEDPAVATTIAKVR